MKPANFFAGCCAINLPELRSAAQFGEQMLAELGSGRSISEQAEHPAIAWRRAELLPLSGAIDGPPQMPPLPIATAADGALLALKALSENVGKLPQNGALLLGERARLMGLRRAGRASTGGHCRLFDTADGRIALNLAREDDWGLIEAWLEVPATSWEEIATRVTHKTTEELVERGVELGLPVAQDEIGPAKPWIEEISIAPVNGSRKKPLVVDLSSLWAGPLAGNLLHLLGCEVIKVESVSRPDGARLGNEEFFDLLNAGKRCVAFDFASSEEPAQLKQMIAAADIVIEASRPRALQQLGIAAEQLVAEKPGKLWIRLMAYGDDENRIGFGDDIGVSAGLCSVMEQAWGGACFVGDAIADPISGIYAALAAWAKWQKGGGCLLNLSMRDIVRHAMQLDDAPTDRNICAKEWQQIAESDQSPFYPMRTGGTRAETLGASTAETKLRLC